MHSMNVKTKYYRLLKAGEKTIELRLYDDKRRQIKAGDEILFSDSSDAADHFTAKVIKMHPAENFDKLCDIIHPKQAGFETKADLLTTLEAFYDLSAQKKFGVVGIEIKRV